MSLDADPLAATLQASGHVVTLALPAGLDEQPAWDSAPRFGPRLRELASPSDRVVIVFTDATRACPDDILIGDMVEELGAAGVPDPSIELIVGTGLHRPMTEAEARAKLGDALYERFGVTQHDARSGDEIVDLGSIDGIPVTINRRCVEADLLLATGIVEPHQFAGFSGGAKTAVIGCGGEATIRATHGPAMLDRPGTRLAAVDGNPFQRFIRAAGAKIGVRYVDDVVLADAERAGARAPHGGSKRVVARASGEPDAVHDALIAACRARAEVSVPEDADVVFAGLPAAKQTNLYQASRAATYLGLAEAAPLAPGTVIVIGAELAEGVGDGAGERRFGQLLRSMEDPASLVERLARDGFPGGGQRAYLLAKVMRAHPIVIVGSQDPTVPASCGLLHTPSWSEAIELVDDLLGRDDGAASERSLRCLIIPDAISTLVRRREQL